MHSVFCFHVVVDLELEPMQSGVTLFASNLAKSVDINSLWNTDVSKRKAKSPRHATKIVSRAVSQTPFLFTQQRDYSYTALKYKTELGSIHLSKCRNVNLLGLLITAAPQLFALATVRAVTSFSQVGDKFKLESCFCSGARQEVRAAAERPFQVTWSATDLTVMGEHRTHEVALHFGKLGHAGIKLSPGAGCPRRQAQSSLSFSTQSSALVPVCQH